MVSSSVDRRSSLGTLRRRFLLIKEANEGAERAPNQIAVVLNWTEELKRLVPAK
jgi:hypothetical protein